MSPDSNPSKISKSLFAAILAVLLFTPLFAFRQIGGFDFWWWMSLNVALAVALIFFLDKSYFKLLKNDLKEDLWKKILLGAVSALLLYTIFFVGNEISRIILPFAGKEIKQIYTFKEGASVLRISLLMIFLIGPGEELFWRGYLQRIWSNRFGKAGGYILAAVLYALVHTASGNIILVLAAGICGLFWGFLYLRYRSVLLNCISHTIWDLMIFVFWTIGG